ncbi:MAG: VOC family protein [Burkholderiaceae bacterium]
MLDRVDRMLMAVNSRERASATFGRLLGAEPAREARSDWLAADCAIMSIGESEIELCEPNGPGPVREHLDRWGEGLLAAGYSTPSPQALAERLDRVGAAYIREGERLYLPGTTTAGLPMAISASAVRPRIGPVSFFYEATNSLESDWREVMARYVEMFGIDPQHFSPIGSRRFGYEGTLTLFDPDRLDRIELSQTFADQPGAMRRFVERRGGDSFYMCYIETHDFDALKARLLEAGATLTPRGGPIGQERDGCWVHPKSLHGMLLGISRETVAWEWSGRPDRVRPPRD